MHKFVLIDEARRKRCQDAIKFAAIGSAVTIREGEGRNLDQNAAMWPRLSDTSKQVLWHGSKLSPEEWKDLFTCGIIDVKVLPNLDSTGFVMVGLSTKRLSKKKFSDLLELITSFGAEREVKWSEKFSTVGKKP